MRFLRLLSYATILTLCAALLVAALWWADGVVSKPMNIPAATMLHVPPGTSVQKLGNELEQKGWIKHGRVLALYARFTGQANRIRAGEYSVQPETTLPELLDQLEAGKSVLYGMTIIEGMSFKELIAAVRASGVLKQTLPVTASAADVMAAIGHAGEHPEGRFLPETYNFPRGTTDVAFLKRAYDDMQVALEEEWQKREPGLPYANAYEALIMASIIEKETGQAFERPEISGVFVRRLRKGMRLQTDPTVIYGMGDSYAGNIRRKDLRTPTPYNTYTIPALPPTPIAMPGKAAIQAALHPAAGTTLFFVSKNDGTHVFSTTLREHERHVDRFQRNRGNK